MNAIMKVTTTRNATVQEQQAIQQAIDILASANLELIGTRPKTRV